jgi:putative exosortase-associated protein (TIGR04073 family)
MKAKVLFLSFAVLFLAVLNVHAEVDQQPRGHNALRKLGRGCSNLLFGIVEVPNQVTKVTSDQGGAAGVTYGVGKGLCRWFAREVVGVYEIITFPIPMPRGYKPVMQPEYPNEDYEP